MIILTRILIGRIEKLFIGHHMLFIAAAVCLLRSARPNLNIQVKIDA